MSKSLKTMKEYRSKAYCAAMEATKLRMQAKCLLSKAELLEAKSMHYDRLADMALENEQFGFDLEV